MNAMARLATASHRLGSILGAPGLIIGLVSILSFAFGLALLAQEYNGLRRSGGDALRTLIAEWARTAPVDDVGRTLRDYAVLWNSAPDGPERERRARSLRAALQNLGNNTIRPREDHFGLVRISSLDLIAPGPSQVARWKSPALPPRDEPESEVLLSVIDGMPFREPRASPASASRLTIRVGFHVNSGVDRVVGDLERTYRRLLLAVAGLSAYSLLCLGYMVLQARNLEQRAARESAQQATIDLADRTCHELGNVTFVLANERRNLAEQLRVIENFLQELTPALLAAARKSGLEAPLADRLARNLERELAHRGLDPNIEMASATLLAGQVCRQIEVCSEYVSLTVRELDSYLKQADQPVALKPVQLSSSFDDALTLLGPRLESSGAIVRRPGPPLEALSVLADRRLLVHALVNLLKNAAEATTSAGVTPRIDLDIRHDPAARTVSILVSDNGPGIPPELLPGLFRSGQSTKGPGRGRGLAIARASLQSQGGSLHVFSSPGQGATFVMTLPESISPVGSSPSQTEEPSDG